MSRSSWFFPSAQAIGIKNALCLAVFALLAFASSMASANVLVTFQLQNVTFASGAVATGTFTLDETALGTTAVDIYYSGNPAVPGGFHFTDPTTAGTGCYELPNLRHLAFCNVVNFDLSISLRFVDPLGSGTDAIVTGTNSTFVDVGQNIFDNVASGSIVPTSVPAPETLSLMGSGLVLLAISRRSLRRRVSQARRAHVV